MSRPVRPRSLREELSPRAPGSLVSGGVALTLSAALCAPIGALAQQAGTPAPAAEQAAPAAAPAATSEAARPNTVTRTGTLAPVNVREKALDPNPNAEPGVPYKARTSGDERRTRPLAETPTTINVITQEAILDSGQTDLKQILSAQPGITLGTGENGNAFGDRYIIRGQEARSDVFVDGLRDPGMTTRETFAIEQLEVTKGPSSTFAGRGSAGGAINAITKQPTLDYDYTRLSAGFGTSNHTRLTVDANKVFSDTFALRINTLYGIEDVPNRDPSRRSRNGLAISGLWEITPNLALTLDYYGLRAKDHYPDLGGYLSGVAPDRGPTAGVPVYAQSNDFLKSNVDTLTARVKYRIEPNLVLNSLTRYGMAENGFGTTGASARVGLNADGSTYSTGGLDNGHTGWQGVKYFAHQSNLRWDKDIAGKKHEFIFGVELTDHKVLSGAYSISNANGFNCRVQGNTGPAGAWCLSDPTGATYSNIGVLAGRQYDKGNWNRDWRVWTVAASVMDTVTLTDKVSVFGGLRLDHYDLSMLTRNATTGVQTGDYSYNGTLFNIHLGGTYKLTPEGMVYASFASAQDINGGEPDSGTSSGYGGLVIYNGQAAGAKPEASRNFEIGTKWNLLNNRLLATAAYFHNTKSKVMEGADYDTLGTFNTGKNRVQGVEFGLAGNVTEKLMLSGGVTFMTSRVLDSATPANVGREISNFANRQVGMMARYQINRALAVGGVVRYRSQMCGGQPDTAAGMTAAGDCSQPVPAYTVFDLFGTYRFNKQLNMRVNLLNVANRDFYTAVYRSGAFLYKGDGRALRVTFNYDLY